FKDNVTYSHTDSRDLADTQKQNVIHETSGCIFQDLPEFLDTFFPLAQLTDGKQAGKDFIKGCIDNFVRDGLLTPEKWLKFPDDDEFEEKQLYAPIGEVLNAITKRCGAENHINWCDSPNKPPQAAYYELLRPDLFAMLNHP